jgi:hypothetical protein
MVALGAGSAWAAAGQPFREGEKLVYRAKWGFISAGEVVMEVLPAKTLRGEKTYHFAMSTRTSSKIDIFYPVREMQDSYTDTKLTRSILYEKRSTAKYPRDVKVDFDWERMTATYTNFGRMEKPVAISPGTLDPLALIYSIRLKDFTVGDVLEVPVTDGKDFAVVRAAVTALETITIGGRSYEAFVVIPETASMKGLLDTLPNLKIWYSTDKARIPIKIQSRFPVGNFAFELVGAAS